MEGRVGKTRWVILIYRIPRDPSRHRVAVWRKLKSLGAIYLQDGVAVLPEDAVTREQFEWLQFSISESGGEAKLWRGEPNTIAEDRALIEMFREARDSAYRKLIDAAGKLERKAALGGTRRLPDDLRKIERAFRAEQRRDYFRSPLRDEARSAIESARMALRQDTEDDTDAQVGS